MHGNPLTLIGQFSGGAGLPQGAVTVAFASLPGSLGWPPSPRDQRRMSVRFADGDVLVAHSLIGPALPEPHPGDTAAHWAALAEGPQWLPLLMQAFCEAGLPRHWRAMAATSDWLASIDGVARRLHWQPDLQMPPPCWAEALQLAGAAPDHADDDLIRALDSGQRPSWTLWQAPAHGQPQAVGELTLHARLHGRGDRLPATSKLSHWQDAQAPSVALPHNVARRIWLAQTELAREHSAMAWALALARLPQAAQALWLSRLAAVHPQLGRLTATALGRPPALPEPTTTEAATPAESPEPEWPAAPVDPAQPLAGRRLGLLTGPDTDRDALAHWVRHLVAAGAAIEVVTHPLTLATCPSAACDAIVLALTEADALHWATQAAARDWVRDAFQHGKAIATTPGGTRLLTRAGVEPDEGITALDARFIEAAARRWPRN